MAIELTVMSLDFDSDEPPRKEVFNKPEILFGRSEDSDVVLGGEEVSTLHAKLFYNENDQLMISDLGSINGTLVDNIPLEANKPVEITENQRILISGYLIKPKLVESSEPFEKEEEVFEDQKLEDSNFSDVFEEAPAEAEEVVELKEDSLNKIDANHESREEISYALGESQSQESLVESVSVKEDTAPSETIKTTENNYSELDGLIQIDFEALKLCKLSGKITNKSKDLSEVNVFINSELKAKSDDNGLFLISDLEEDTKLKISFEKTGFVIEPKELNLTIDSDKELSISAKKLITIKGRVANKGNPVSEAIVVASGIGETTTDQNGVYTFENVLEDTPISIQVSKDGFSFKSKK